MTGGIAYCGLDCELCPAQLATRSGDMEKLEEVASRWSRQSGCDISAESILCDGCRRKSERKNPFCQVCEIARCARERHLASCAGCPRYPCRTLKKHPAYTEEARRNLERIRKGLRN